MPLSFGRVSRGRGSFYLSFDRSRDYGNVYADPRTGFGLVDVVRFDQAVLVNVFGSRGGGVTGGDSGSPGGGSSRCGDGSAPVALSVTVRGVSG